MIEILNGRSAGTFDEVVDGAKQDDPRSIFAHRDVDIVGSCNILRRRQVRHDSYETIERIVTHQALADLIGRDTGDWMDIDRREDTSFHRSQMRGENDFGLDAAKSLHDVDNLRLVPVIPNRIRTDRFVDFAIEIPKLGSPTGSTDPRFTVDNDVLG